MLKIVLPKVVANYCFWAPPPHREKPRFLSNQLTRLVELVISGLKPPEMSEGRTEEADGPPVKMVWVLKEPTTRMAVQSYRVTVRSSFLQEMALIYSAKG